MYTDQDGEFFFLAVIIGAVIGGISAAAKGGNFGDILLGAAIGGIAAGVGAGVGNLVAGGAFFGSAAMSATGLTAFTAGAAGGFAGGFIGAAGNAWANGSNFGQGLVSGLKTGFVGAVGGSLAMFGGGTIFENIAWGAAGGTITGGLSAALYGGDIGQGMLLGAGAGAAFASVSSGIEAYGNYRGGHGFRTNAGVIKNYTRLGQYDNAIGFVQAKYGMTGVDMEYKEGLVNSDGNPIYGDTDLSGNVRIGDPAFESPSMLKATIIHEYTHSVSDRVFLNGRWQWNLDRQARWNHNDGVRAYASEIIHSGRMHINRSILKLIIPGSPPFKVNPVWHQPGIIKGKFWHTIPRRFF